MPSLVEVFPDAMTLLALTPEELGDVMLELIHRGIASPDMFGAHDFLHAINHQITSEWPEAMRKQVRNAVLEAFTWLERAGFIMLDPEQPNQNTYYTLTRRGQQLSTRQQSTAYRESAILPTGLVHPEILAKASAAFLRGDHDVAVLSAFKTIEIAVRKAGGYPEGELGVKLMRKAFEPGKGPLADKMLEAGEQQAQADLFAGAIGAAKNPASHRDVEMGSAEAARLILFASYLLFIVDSRSGK